MEKVRRRVELVVCKSKAQPCEEPARRNIVWIMASKDRFYPVESKSILDNARCGFDGIALFPVPRRHVNAQLERPRLNLARSEAAATDVLPSGEKEYRPILNAVSALSLDFELQSGLHFLRRIAATRDVARNGGITPKIHGELNVGVTPAAKTEPGRLKKIATHTDMVTHAAKRAWLAA